MPWASRRLSTVERMDIVALQAERLGVTRRETARRAHSAQGLNLPGGQRLIFDGRYFLLTPTEARR